MRILYPIRTLPDRIDRRFRSLAGDDWSGFRDAVPRSLLGAASVLVNTGSLTSAKIGLRWVRGDSGAVEGMIGIDGRSPSRQESVADRSRETPEMIAALSGLDGLAGLLRGNAGEGIREEQFAGRGIREFLGKSIDELSCYCILRSQSRTHLLHEIDAELPQGAQWLSHPFVAREVAGTDDPWSHMDKIRRAVRSETWLIDVSIRPLRDDPVATSLYSSYYARILRDIVKTEEAHRTGGQRRFISASESMLRDVRSELETSLRSFSEEPQYAFSVRCFAASDVAAAGLAAHLGELLFGSGRYQLCRASDNYKQQGVFDAMFSTPLIIPGASAEEGFSIIDADLPDNSGHPEDDRSCVEWSRALQVQMAPLSALSSWMTIPVVNESRFAFLPSSTDTRSEAGRSLLKVRDTERNADVDIQERDLRRHLFITGMTGSGKTTTIKSLLCSLWADDAEKRTPFLVIEPSKREYRELRQISPQLQDDMWVLTPGQNDVWPLCINLLDPIDSTAPRHQHVSLLSSALQAALPLPTPLPFLLPRAMEAVYRSKGWLINLRNTLNTGDIPDLPQLVEMVDTVLHETGYAADIRDNLAAMIGARLGHLLRGAVGAVFAGPVTIPTFSEILRRPVLIELDALAEQDKNLITLFLLQAIRELRRREGTSRELKHVIILEEAHTLVSSAQGDSGVSDLEFDPKSEASRLIETMLAEVRALGQGFVIADQSPAMVPVGVLRNTRTKLVHQIVDPTDRRAMVESLGLSATQGTEVMQLIPGDAFLLSDTQVRPIPVRILSVSDPRDDSLTSDEELVRQLRTGDSLSSSDYSHHRQARIRAAMVRLREHVSDLVDALVGIGFDRDHIEQITVHGYDPLLDDLFRLEKREGFTEELRKVVGRFVPHLIDSPLMVMAEIEHVTSATKEDVLRLRVIEGLLRTLQHVLNWPQYSISSPTAEATKPTGSDGAGNQSVLESPHEHGTGDEH